MLKYFLILLVSSVKFAFAPAFAHFKYDLGFTEIVILTSIGGILGILFFAFLTKYIMIFWNWFTDISSIEEISDKFSSHKEKKTFTRKNRLIINAKSNYGLIGIALLTPIILSIPIGTFLALRYFPNTKTTLLYLIASTILWSNILTFVFTSF